MFRIDNYLEVWASNFKPISHVVGGKGKAKRFYRMDSIHKLPEFSANLTNAMSPSMGVVTQVDLGENKDNPKFYLLTWRIFFFVKQKGSVLQNGVTDEVAAADAKAEGFELANKLMAYLYNDKTVNKNPELQGLVLDSTEIFSIPEIFNGWWATEMMIGYMISRPKCINQEDYSK